MVVHKGHTYCNGTCQRHRAPHKFSQHQLAKTATDQRRCVDCIAGAQESRNLKRVAEAMASYKG